ncbi:MAG: hypothetical protein VB814_13375 [Pirellulaceae bacterium]
MVHVIHCNEFVVGFLAGRRPAWVICYGVLAQQQSVRMVQI